MPQRKKPDSDVVCGCVLAACLRACLQLLPKQGKFVFEFRDASWLCPEVYAVLKQHDWCLAITHLTGAAVSV